jgi:hypothetical protein
MFGLEEEEAPQAAPQGRSLAGNEPVEQFQASWQMVKLRTLPKLTYKGYRLFSDAKGNKVDVMLESGTPIRVYSGKVVVIFDGKEQTINTLNSKGESLVETLPDAKSRFWNSYPTTPENLTLMQSQEFKDTNSDRLAHMMWLPIKMEGSEAPDLLDEAIKGKYDAIKLPEVPPPPTPPDKGQPKGTADDTILSVALGVGGALLLASLLDSRKK